MKHSFRVLDNIRVAYSFATLPDNSQPISLPEGSGVATGASSVSCHITLTVADSSRN